MTVLKQNSENIESLISLLASPADKVRTTARKSLVTLGKPSVSSLSGLLEDSTVYKARWEAAKALGAIQDTKAIPSLVKALEDSESDVAWLAADALEKFKKAAWPELLRVLTERGAESVSLRHGAHHVFRRQRDREFAVLLAELREALASDTVPESTPIAAYNLLERMRK